MQTEVTTRNEIRAAYKAIQTDLRSGTGTPENREEAVRRLEEIKEPLSYLIGDRGFEEFVEERLEHYHRESDKALCSCWRSACPIKRGEVPPKIRQHGTTLTGQRPPAELLVEYLNHHDGGEALTLIRQEWSQMAVDIDLELGEIRSILKGTVERRERIARNLGVSLDDNGTPTDDSDEGNEATATGD